MKMIPEDIQFGLLERKVGPSVAQVIRNNCDKKYKELQVVGKHEQISCFGWPIERNPRGGGWEDIGHQYLHLLIDPKNGEIIEENFGIEDKKSNMPLWFGIPLYTLSIIGIPFLPSYLNEQLNPSKRAAREKANNLYSLRKSLWAENFDEVKKLADSLGVYQESISEVAKQIGNDLELIDTGKKEAFLTAKNPLFLKAHAALLGADILVNFKGQHSSNSFYNIYDVLQTQDNSAFYGTPVKFKDKNLRIVA
jgi:hypothetical protein